MNRWHAHPVRELTPDEMIREGLGRADLWVLAMIGAVIGALALIAFIYGGPAT